MTKQALTLDCYHAATTSIASASVSRRPRSYQKSGVYTLKRAIRTLGSRTIDRRTRVGKALAAWCTELARDLGGLDALSTAQRALIEQAASTRLLLDSIDAWLVQQPSLVDKRKRALLPVVRERQSLADALVRYLTALGLERKVKDLTDLSTYLATKQLTKSATSLEVRPPGELASFATSWRPSHDATSQATNERVRPNPERNAEFTATPPEFDESSGAIVNALGGEANVRRDE